MKKTKFIISSMLTIIMAFCLNCNVYANTPNAVEEHVLPEGIYEGAQMQTVANMLGYDMITDDGYVLDSISVSAETSEANTSTDNLIPTSIGDYIGNVKKVSSDVYFKSNPIASNWYDGPLSKLTKTYSRTVSATYNCTTSVSTDVLNAGFLLTSQVAQQNLQHGRDLRFPAHKKLM